MRCIDAFDGTPFMPRLTSVVPEHGHRETIAVEVRALPHSGVATPTEESREGGPS